MENHEEHDRTTKERIINDIKAYDCHLGLLESDGYLPAFVYSIGLFEKFKHPEIIVFGLRHEVMGAMVNHARDEIREGVIFQAGATYSGFLEGYEVHFLAVDGKNYGDYLGYAGWYYGYSWDFPVLQMVWPDKENRWPWEGPFNEDWKYKQPLLDRNADFKFYEPKNLGVYTTHHALEGKPILHVYHNDNGDWQFHTESDPQVEDAKLVCLEELVKRDLTLNGIYHLNYGESAYRSKIGGEWTIKK